MMLRKCLILALYLVSIQSWSLNLAVGWELWYPYQYYNKQQQLAGLDFDIFNAIVKEAGLDVTYTEIPWKRHLHYIKTGKMDIAMGASYTKEREEYAYFTMPYRQEVVKIFVKKGTAKSIKLSSLSELVNSPYMLGVESGYYYGDEYHKLIQQVSFQEHISEVIDIEENITLLMEGHLDGILVDPVTMKAFTEKYKMQDEFELHPLEIYQADIHIMISKASCSFAMANNIDQAIKRLKEKDQIEKIIARWSLARTPKAQE